jgi:UDP-N-acetylglucosamine 4-epimerase
MNHLAASTENPDAIGQVFNTAVGERTTLLELTQLLKNHLSKHDPKIAEVKIIHGPERKGDIPHSLASVEKAKVLFGYEPTHRLEEGLKEAVRWYVVEYKNSKVGY